MPKLKDTPEQAMTKLFKTQIAERGWNQEHLAKLCGTDAGKISRAINNPSRQKYETLCLMARKLGLKELPVL